MFNDIKGIRERCDIFYYFLWLFILEVFNVILIKEIVCYLKIFKNGMLVYESFNCVYDLCFSFLVIGRVGWLFCV